MFVVVTWGLGAKSETESLGLVWGGLISVLEAGKCDYNSTGKWASARENKGERSPSVACSLQEGKGRCQEWARTWQLLERRSLRESGSWCGPCERQRDLGRKAWEAWIEMDQQHSRCRAIYISWWYALHTCISQVLLGWGSYQGAWTQLSLRFSVDTRCVCSKEHLEIGIVKLSGGLVRTAQTREEHHPVWGVSKIFIGPW